MTTTEEAKLHADIHMKVEKLLSYNEVNAKILDDYLDNAIASMEQTKQMFETIDKYYTEGFVDKKDLLDSIGGDE